MAVPGRMMRSRIGLPYFDSPSCRYGVSGDVAMQFPKRVDHVERRPLAGDLTAENQRGLHIDTDLRRIVLVDLRLAGQQRLPDVLRHVVQMTEGTEAAGRPRIVRGLLQTANRQLRGCEIAGRHDHECPITRVLEEVHLAVNTHVVERPARARVRCEHESFVDLDSDTVGHALCWWLKRGEFSHDSLPRSESQYVRQRTFREQMHCDRA